MHSVKRRNIKSNTDSEEDKGMVRQQHQARTAVAEPAPDNATAARGTSRRAREPFVLTYSVHQEKENIVISNMDVNNRRSNI